MNEIIMISRYREKLDEVGELYLRVKIRPGASSNEIKTIMDDETIKINISAPPANGRANTALIKFISKEFGVRRECVKIISGASDRTKLIKLVHI